MDIDDDPAPSSPTPEPHKTEQLYPRATVEDECDESEVRPMDAPSNPSPQLYEPQVAEQLYHRATVGDEHDDSEVRWIEDYPGPAGTTYGRCESTFNKHRTKQESEGNQPWHPF